MDELIEAGLHMEAEIKSKTGQYVFEIIDSVSVPPEDDICLIVDKHAKAIKAGAEVRANSKRI